MARKLRGRNDGLSFAVITFVCTFGAALIGMFIRTKLPPTHLIKESDDVIQRGMGLVATMTALLLGLVTAAAKGLFDSTDLAVKSTAAAVLTLDRHLVRYGPETAPTRELLRRATAFRIEAMWPSSGAPLRLDASPIEDRSVSRHTHAMAPLGLASRIVLWMMTVGGFESAARQPAVRQPAVRHSERR